MTKANFSSQTHHVMESPAVSYQKNLQPHRAKPQEVKILVVEDNMILQFALEEMLAKLGYKADFAKDGKTALALYHPGYQLILMDIDLPDVDGITVTKTIRSVERDVHVPIVAMTSHEEKEYQNKCLRAGMDGFSNKPTLSQLQAIISKHLKDNDTH